LSRVSRHQRARPLDDTANFIEVSRMQSFTVQEIPIV